MPRRRVLTEPQLEALFALPMAEAALIRHYTLSPEDLAAIARRRQPHNRLGFALQLCALRFPGRLIRPGELVPLEAVAFVAEQLDIDPAALAEYAAHALLDKHPETAVSTLAWARQSPGAPGHRSLARLVEQLQHLRRIGIEPGATNGIHADRVKQLERQGARLTAQHLRAIGPRRRQAILLVTVLETITRLTDEGIGLFDRLIGRLFRRAERRASATLQTNARSLNDKLRLLTKVGDTLIEAKETGADTFEAVGKVIPWDRFAGVMAEAKGLTRDDGPDYLTLATANHALLRRAGPLFLDAFEFKGTAAVTGLLRAMAAMRLFYAGNRRSLPKDIPTGFIRRSWRAAVFRNGTIDGQAYELCLFAELRDRLRAGDLWVIGSRQYRAVEDQLITKDLFAEMRAAGPLPVAVPLDAAGYLQDRKTQMDARLRVVGDKASQDRLTDVRLSGGTLKITPLEAATPKEADRLADRVYALLPRVRITDLLEEVADWTGVAECFTHLRTGLPADNRRVVLTAVLADATNLGLTRMAEACTVASYKQLVWTAGWHVGEDTYGQALARVVAAQQAQPLATHFGSGGTSSSDGQHFPLGGRGEVTGAVNPHKDADPAVSFYTHLSGRYAPYRSRAISVIEGEAPHVIDGLLYHGTNIKVAIHHTDGGGVSDHVFALCHLLGFRFAPRIPNLHDRRLYTFGPAATWPNLEPFIAGRIDEALIQTHWEDLLRLATSVRTGAVPASLMLKRLGSYPRQNGLAWPSGRSAASSGRSSPWTGWKTRPFVARPRPS